MKSQDIILLQWSIKNYNNYNKNGKSNDIFLRSHDLKFTVDNENYQEVVTHDQRIGENDQVLYNTVQYC